jgi:hypothetical protein
MSSAHQDDFSEEIAVAINAEVVKAKTKRKLTIKLFQDVCNKDPFKWRWLNGFLTDGGLSLERSTAFYTAQDFDHQQHGKRRELTFKKDRDASKIVTAASFGGYTLLAPDEPAVLPVCKFSINHLLRPAFSIKSHTPTYNLCRLSLQMKLMLRCHTPRLLLLVSLRYATCSQQGTYRYLVFLIY